jgi:hypothetical protein
MAKIITEITGNTVITAKEIDRISAEFLQIHNRWLLRRFKRDGTLARKLAKNLKNLTIRYIKQSLDERTMS